MEKATIESTWNRAGKSPRMKKECRVFITQIRYEHSTWSGLRDLNPRSLGPKPSAIPNFAKPGYSIFQLWSNMWSRAHVREILRGEKGRKTEVYKGLRAFGFFPNLGGVTCSQNKRDTALCKSWNRSAEGRNIIYDFAGNCKDFLKVGYSLALKAGYGLALEAGYSLSGSWV